MSARLKPVGEQVIVVTGATSGNGLAIVERACARGAAVVAVARNADALDALRDRLTRQGARIEPCVADVSDQAAVDAAAALAMATFGRIDAWINNAAVGTYGSVDAVPPADHRRVFDVNYFGTLHGCLAAARAMRGRGGAIVNVGSIVGDRAMIQQGPYSATKHAVQALTDTLRMELERAGAGIAVTLVKPAAIDTPFPEHARNHMGVPPCLPPPLYTPDVVADAVLFACAHPRRTLYAGGAGLVLSAGAQLFPRITDAIMKAIGTGLQQRPGDPIDPARADNLHEPRDDARRSAQGRLARGTSVALQLQKWPLATLGAALVPAVLALRRRRRGN